MTKKKHFAEKNTVTPTYDERYTKLITTVGWVSLIITAAIVLLPYLTNQLWLDDIFNSELWWIVHRFNISVFHYALLGLKQGLKDGRLIITSLYLDPIFYFIRDVRAFRVFSVGMFLVNVGLFVYILHRLKASIQFIAVFLLCFFVLIKITHYYDPIAAFGCMYPGLAMMLFAAILLILKWRESQNYAYLYLSVIINFVSMLCYEINIIYFPIALYLIYSYKQNRQQLIKKMAIILIPLLIFFILELVIKLNAVTPYSGTAIGDINSFFETYLKQLIAVVPGSYYWFILSNSYSLGYLWDLVKSNPLSWMLILCVAVSLIVFLCFPFKKNDTKINYNIYIIGIFLLLLSPILIALSARYQNELVWGIGYLPIYYQYFGLAIIITGILMYLRKNKAVIYCLIMLIALYSGFNWNLNVLMKNTLDDRYWSKRSLIDQGEQTGFLSPIKDGDVVDIKTISEAVNGDVIFHITGKRVHVPMERRTLGAPALDMLPGPNPQYFRLYTIDNLGSPQWVLTQITADQVGQN